MDLVKIFDFFGYIPQFLIQKESHYKSTTGGFISLFFILISLIYTISEFYDFFSKIDVLQSSRKVIKSSFTYNLTSKDIYFGVGMIDRNGKEFNVSMFPYLNFELDYLYTDKDTMNETRLTSKMGPCQISKFLPFEEFEVLSVKQKEKLKKKIPFYLCPQDEFNFKMSAPNFIDGDIFIQVTIGLTNTSVIELAKSDLAKKLGKIHSYSRL